MDEFEIEDLFEEEDRNVQLSDGEAEVEQDAENADQTNNVASSSQASGTPVQPPKKRVIKNPRPKLDAERLCGKRGIPILPKTFENINFKGKGHEKEDLDRIMSVLEHWAHRLYPCLKFDEVLEKIENLGKKKPVQVCIRKIRMDMPVLHEDFMGNHHSDEEVDIADVPTVAQDSDDPFERLLQMDDTAGVPHSSSQHNNIGTDDAVVISQSEQQCTASRDSQQELTNEQRERMRISREKALERRKMRQSQGNPPDPVTSATDDSCIAAAESSKQDWVTESDTCLTADPSERA